MGIVTPNTRNEYTATRIYRLGVVNVHGKATHLLDYSIASETLIKQGVDYVPIFCKKKNILRVNGSLE